jgi:hypothetical protein
MVFMKRQTVLTQKRRGPVPTGKGTLVGVRFQPAELKEIDGWILEQDDGPTRPEAVRRLVKKSLPKHAPVSSALAQKRSKK